MKTTVLNSGTWFSNQKAYLGFAEIHDILRLYISQGIEKTSVVKSAFQVGISG